MALKRCSQFIHLIDSNNFLKTLQRTQFYAPLCVNSSSNFVEVNNSKQTVLNVTKSWETRFEKENIPEPLHSIQNILLHVLGCRNFNDLKKYAEIELTDKEVKETEKLCQCRLARMPIQYTIGEWDFKGMRIRTTPPVFIPRPETEKLVDLGLKCLPHLNECDACEISQSCKINVLEIGTGTGVVSFGLLQSHPKIQCFAIDQSSTACILAQENALELGYEDRISIFHSKLENDGTFSKNVGLSTFDLIVSNPPYIPSAQMLNLSPEIKLYEDLRALDGGPDGLQVIKPLLRAASRLLRHKGHLLLEVDSSHPSIIEKWLSEPDQAPLRLRFESTHEDIFKRPRFVQIIKTK